MRYQTGAAILGLVLLLSSCSGSSNVEEDLVSDASDNTNPAVSLSDASASANPFDPVSQPLDQPMVDNGDVVLVDDTTAAITGSDSDEVAAEAAIEDAPDVLNQDNLNAVILQAFEVYSGRAYDRRMTGFPYLEKIAVQFQEPQFNEFADVLVYRSVDCSNDGAVSETSSEAYQPLLVDSLFSACTVGSDQLNGRVVLSHWDFSGFQRQFSDLFAVSFPGNGIMEVEGSYQYRTSLGFNRELVINDLNYNLAFDGGALSVQNANTTRKYRMDGFRDENDVFSMMEGSFTMAPPALNGASVSVATTEAFENHEKSSQLSYARGRLQIIANDSEIIVDADNGDPNTVEVSLISSTGPVSTRTVEWGSWHDALAFEPPGLTGYSEEALPQLGSDPALINQDSFTEILRSAFEIYNGESIGPSILQMTGYPQPASPSGIGTPSFPDGFAEPVLETCDNGGSAVLTPYKWGARQITTGWDSEFSNCERNGELYEGIFKTRNFGNFVYRSPGISIGNASGSIQLNGSLDYKHTSNRDGGPSVHVGFSGSFTDSTRGANSLEVTAASSRFSGFSQYTSLISGKFHMKNAATNQNWVAVSTPDPLTTSARLFEVTSESNNYPITGTMIIEAGNGNSLWLQPDNGDLQTFELFIYESGAEPVQRTVAWSDWLPYLQFNYDLHNR